jgi:four helix bundle protein
MRDFKDLKVWQKSHECALAIYRETEAFPRRETFGLTSQIRRAASSIGANLAEGCGRQTDGELARYIQISMGSASELEYHLMLARDLGYLNKERHELIQSQLTLIRKMLANLLHAVSNSRAKAAHK